MKRYQINKIYIICISIVLSLLGYKFTGIKYNSNIVSEPQAIYESATIIAGFSPNGNIANLIIEEINRSKKVILVEAYSFTSKPISNALIKAHQRGIDIRVILDRSQASQKYSAANYLVQKNIRVNIDVNHALFHNKIIIIDNKKVITGSYNFTTAAENKNAENILEINSTELANIYTEDFEKNWEQSVSAENFNINNSNTQERKQSEDD